MIGMIMSKKTEYDEIDYIEILIRKFLNLYDKFDNILRSKNDNPSWMTQYNFLCLLNIPYIMRFYGCNRNIWEGGKEEEGFLRKYKQELKNGIKHNWQIWTINNLLQRNVFNKEQLDNNLTWKQILSSECRIYQSHQVLCKILSDGEPISGICLNLKKYICVCFRSNNVIYGIYLMINWNDYETYCNMKYYKIIQANTHKKITIDEEIVSNASGCLLLPRLNNNDNNILSYCIVYSDWRR